MALQCVLRQPELFGRVGSQFATVMRASDLEEAINLAGDRKPVMYLQWGTYHLRSPHEAWDMARANRDLWTLLREHGFRPAGGEVPEGFAWACWRGHTENMLRALYPLR
jgi:enterochelin esterase-like enzyme